MEQKPIWPSKEKRAPGIENKDRETGGLLSAFAELSSSNQFKIEEEIRNLKNNGINTSELKKKVGELILAYEKLEKTRQHVDKPDIKTNSDLRKSSDIQAKIDQNILKKYDDSSKYEHLEELLELKNLKEKSSWDVPLSRSHGKRGREPQDKNKLGDTIRGKEYSE